MERVRRVELPTLCLASIRSSQLSYTRMGFCLQEVRSFVNFALLLNAIQTRLAQAKKLQVIFRAGPNCDHSGEHEKIHPRGI